MQTSEQTVDRRASTTEVVGLVDATHSEHQLSFVFCADQYRFTTSYWYDSVNLVRLSQELGEEAFDQIIFHIAAFEINKICSLRPKRLEWGRFQRFVTPEFAELWRTIFRNVWAQWRYENDDPDYYGPEFRADAGAHAPLRRANNSNRMLCFFGGGKDSIVATHILDQISQKYDSLVYSSSIYGTSQSQHALIERALSFAKPANRRRQWIFDDFLDSPVLEFQPQRTPRTLTAAETPSSVFAALPFVIAHGYQTICLAHERSADTGQVRWDVTGEDVNHQWGKSFKAESLINSYLSSRLVPDFHYFSVLKPVYDVVIFYLLRQRLDAVPATHSCNVQKPWCRRCSKCVYVWLNYLAYLPSELVEQMFGENLFGVEENRVIFRQLLGLEAHLPFECIGQVDEVKLAFEICRRKGMRGPIMDLYVNEVKKPNLGQAIEKYTTVDMTGSALPPAIMPATRRLLEQAAGETRQYIQNVLLGSP